MADHYYTKKPASKLRTKEISATIAGKEFKLITGSGVFGKDKVDTGTVLLIESSKIEDKESFSLLDLGCGYGIVGVALKKLNPKISVTCSDVNERAVKLTEKNSKLNKTEVKAVQSNLFENISDDFDAILVNLPQNAGKEICFSMIQESYNHLNENGSLQVVSRHQKGGKQYEKKMEEVFNNCDTLARGSGYRVYISTKSSS